MRQTGWRPCTQPARDAGELRLRRSNSPDGEPVTVVHLTAEYFPYARTGGLAEAVSGPGQLPAGRRARRRRHPAALPHGARRGARPRAGRAAVPGPMGRPHRGGARLPRGRAAAPGPQVYFIEHLEYFNRHGIYGENARRLPRQRTPLRLLRSRRAHRPAPAGRRARSLLHAHDWHTALALVYLRTSLAGDALSTDVDRRALGAQPGLSGPLSARGDARDRAALGAVQLAAARVVRQGELPQGRAGLRRLRHHGEPHPGRGAAHRRRRLRPARRLHLAGRPARRDPQRHRPASLGSGHRRADHRPVLGRRVWTASAAARRRSSARSGCPSAGRCRSSA